MRLFIAIDFSEEKKDKLNNIINDFRLNTIKGNFTSKNNLHLTIVFLGETDNVNNIKSAMDGINADAFNLCLKGIGKFPRQDGDIYWLGVQKENNLINIYRQLYELLTDRGFPLENKKYNPHLTIGRRVIVKKGFDYLKFGDELKTMNIKVSDISLMKSERIEGRLLYTPIYIKKLDI